MLESFFVDIKANKPKTNENYHNHRWNEQMLKDTETAMKSLSPDENAPYYRHLSIDLNSVTPLVTGREGRKGNC